MGTAEAVAAPVRRWRFPATPPYVAHARYVASAHAKWLGADSDAVALAVSEAFTNAIVHGYGADTAGEVEILALRHPAELEIRVSDDGRGIDPGAAQRADAGFGLALLRQITSRLDLRLRPEGGTQVLMAFPLTGARAGAHRSGDAPTGRSAQLAQLRT